MGNSQLHFVILCKNFNNILEIYKILRKKYDKGSQLITVARVGS